MTRVIHKAQIVDTEFTVKASVGAFKVLTVHEQDGIPTVWYETLEKPLIPVDVTFMVVPTGGVVPDHSLYIGTAFCKGYVLHIYQHPSI